MKTEIKITANLNDEQLDVLIQEIKNTAEMMDVKLEVESNELVKNDTSVINDQASCLSCYYSNNGKSSCDRHLNKLKPDYSKGVECVSNNFAHYRPLSSINYSSCPKCSFEPMIKVDGKYRCEMCDYVGE